jgi:tRNA1Val (adenine37-N6)-methyltransferase
MANSYFKFKQFTVEQERVAMKVCTDACLFGAWVAATLPNADRVLDIGTGTGLLSLMYAQKNPLSVIDAVEIDAMAADQATGNFRASLWSERLKVHHSSILEFKQAQEYDLILTNPPFFENDLRSDEETRNKAMHDSSLTLDALKKSIGRLITPDGKLAVLLPSHRTEYFTDLLLSSGWHLLSGLSVKQTPRHNYFRSLLAFGKTPPQGIIQKELIIKDENNNYSSEFTALLKDYYLYL